MTCLSQLTSFLFKCSQSECGFHLVVDDDARNYLHQLLLRKIAPLIVGVDSFSMVSSAVSRASGPSSEELVGDDSTTLALAVIKSCCVIRYLPFKEGSWATLAGKLLAEAFAVPESQKRCRRRGHGLDSVPTWGVAYQLPPSDEDHSAGASEVDGLGPTTARRPRASVSLHQECRAILA